MGILDEEEVRTTTFRRSGEVVTGTTWVARLPDGRIGMQTQSFFRKINRLRNDPQIVIGSNDGGSAEIIRGRAVIVPSGDPDYAAVQAAILNKYGEPAVVSSRRYYEEAYPDTSERPRVPYVDVAVVITVDSDPA
jgi:hypothetical protein